MQDRVRNASTTMDVLALGREFVSLAEDGRESAAGWPKTTYGVSKMLLIAYGILMPSCACGVSGQARQFVYLLIASRLT